MEVLVVFVAAHLFFNSFAHSIAIQFFQFYQTFISNIIDFLGVDGKEFIRND